MVNEEEFNNISINYARDHIDEGQYINDAKNVTNRDIANSLNLPPVKLHCSMLAEEAIKSAIKNIKTKMIFTKS